MCQLLFTDLGKHNRVFLTQQMILNSLDNNHDGCGVFTTDEEQKGLIWKTKLSAAYITNFGTCLRKFIAKNPVISHVRFASDKKLVSEDHSHPFKGERFILAHNGRLEPKDVKKIDKTKVDSLHFLISFENWWNEYPKLDFPTALSKFMEEWEGKFAFLIYDSVGLEYYVVRGETADLHWAQINGKLVINTSKKTLEIGLDLFEQFNQVYYGKTNSVTEVKEVDKNSIFKVDTGNSTLIKVGDIKENKTYASNYTFERVEWTSRGKVTDTNNPHLDRLNKIETASEELNMFMAGGLLFLDDINLICLTLLSKNLVELTGDDWKILKDDILTELAKLATKEKIKIWEAILKLPKSKEKMYNNYINFPWMVNLTTELNKAHDDLLVSLRSN